MRWQETEPLISQPGYPIGPEYQIGQEVEETHTCENGHAFVISSTRVFNEPIRMTF